MKDSDSEDDKKAKQMKKNSVVKGGKGKSGSQMELLLDDKKSPRKKKGAADFDSDDDDQKKKRGRSIDPKSKSGARSRSQPSIGKKQTQTSIKEEPPKLRKPINPYLQVTEFYLGGFKAPICGADIFEMHAW